MRFAEGLTFVKQISKDSLSIIVGAGVKRGHFRRCSGPMGTTDKREFLSKSYIFLNYQRSSFA